MINFKSSESKLTREQIEACFKSVNVKLPDSLKECYLLTNGGVPELYAFENQDLDTVVSEFLPLVSEHTGTSVMAYKNLVVEKKIVPETFFPFAVDGGGDYFFVDTGSALNTVYFYSSDTVGNPLIDLKLSIHDFWNYLKGE